MARDDDMMTPDDSGSDELVPAWTPDRHLDEGTIHTWLDGAFDEAQSAIVAAHVDGCARCSESVAEARGFIAGASRMVRALDAVPSDVVAHADVVRVASRIVAAAVADVTRTAGAPAPARVRRAWYRQPVMRAAAGMLVIVGGGTYVWSRTSPAPAIESRVAAEQSVTPAAPPSEVPKPAAASEPSTSFAPAVRANRQPPAKEARADASSANLVVEAPDSTRVITSQSIDDRSRAAGAVASERRAFAADAAAPAPPAAPPRAMGDSGARVVSGRVTTPSGAPAAGILVTVVGRERSGTTTDSAGAYRLQVVGDSVTLLARQLGYAPRTQAVVLRSRDSARVDLKMEPSIAMLNSVTATGSPKLSEKVPDVPAPTRSAPGVSAASAGLVQANIIVRGDCWSVRANGSPALRLPTHLWGTPHDGVGSTSSTWFNWPAMRLETDVEMSTIRTDTFTSSSVAGRDTVKLTLTRRGNEWTGFAMQSDGTTRLERPVVLRRVSDSVCKR